MRKLDLVEFVSVDGVMQGLAGPDGDFPYPGWGLEYPVESEESPDSETFAGTGAFLFGRRTYEEMQAFWPHQPESNPMAASLNSTPKYVVSSTVTDSSWEPTTVIPGDDLTASVAALKSEGTGTIVVLGSGQLARSLLAAGLVDGLTLFVHPLLLGTGTRLFGELPELNRLQLASSRTSAHGSLVLNYTLGAA